MLEKLDGAIIDGTYTKSNSAAIANLKLDIGGTYTAKAPGGGYDRMNTAIGEVLEDYFNDEVSLDIFENLPEIYGVTIKNGILKIDGGVGASSWKKILDYLGFRVEGQSTSDEAHFYIFKAN